MGLIDAVSKFADPYERQARLYPALLAVCPLAIAAMCVFAAYSAEVDRLFRRNVTGDSAESALQLISTRIGHVQSRFGRENRLTHEL